MSVVRVMEHFDPTASSVEAAGALARRAIEAANLHDKVVLDFSGFRGGTSSLFNAVLHALREALGADAVRNRIEFRFDTAAQRMIFERSREAALRVSA